MTNGEILRRLQDFVDYPHEELSIELKGWLDFTDGVDKADLAQALIAIANHCGGYVLIGFRQQGGSWEPDPSRPANLANYNQDIVNGIVERYAEPAFHCELHHVPRSDTSLPHPVIVVPGGHGVPIRSKRDGPNRQHVKSNTYYIRRPGPCSEAPRTGREWDALIRKCVVAAREGLLDDFRRIMYGELPMEPRPEVAAMAEAAAALVPPRPEEDLLGSQLERWDASCRQRWETLARQRFGTMEESPYSQGSWTAAYTFDWLPRPQFGLSDLLDTLRSVQGHETGWPTWWVPTRTDIAPYNYEDAIECWLVSEDRAADAAHADFWRASLPPRMFLLRGYQEDSPVEPAPWQRGTFFDLTLPVWRVGEVLLHASRLAAALNVPDATVAVQFRWTGLAGRRLVSWADPRRDLFEERTSRQGEVLSTIRPTAAEIPDRLPELVQAVTQPLYELFDFFSPPPPMFQEELARMRSRSL